MYLHFLQANEITKQTFLALQLASSGISEIALITLINPNQFID